MWKYCPVRSYRREWRNKVSKQSDWNFTPISVQLTEGTVVVFLVSLLVELRADLEEFLQSLEMQTRIKPDLLKEKYMNLNYICASQVFQT